jgi:hypothetical protein
VLFVAATAYFVVVGRRHPGREESVYARDAEPEDDRSGGPAQDVSDQ